MGDRICLTPGEAVTLRRKNLPDFYVQISNGDTGPGDLNPFDGVEWGTTPLKGYSNKHSYYGMKTEQWPNGWISVYVDKSEWEVVPNPQVIPTPSVP